MRPGPDDRICDPACGTGGFFLGAYASILNRFPHLEPHQTSHLRSGAFTGWEIADLPARLCAMNLLLHGIESPESDSPVHVDDALREAPPKRFDMVLTNPPFGRSSSDSYERDDFWATTRNKQLNFVQHVVSLLRVGGTAAVVVPDNVLFEAGAGETIRRRLLHDCKVHTLLRLPTGIFYAQGVKANVLFFRRREGAEAAWTRELWIYDLRTNKHFTRKQNPLKRADLDDFVSCYKPGELHRRVESERFKRLTYDELIARDKVSLDIAWLRDDSLTDTDDLPTPRRTSRRNRRGPASRSRDNSSSRRKSRIHGERQDRSVDVENVTAHYEELFDDVSKTFRPHTNSLSPPLLRCLLAWPGTPSTPPVSATWKVGETATSLSASADLTEVLQSRQDLLVQRRN